MYPNGIGDDHKTGRVDTGGKLCPIHQRQVPFDADRGLILCSECGGKHPDGRGPGWSLLTDVQAKADLIAANRAKAQK